MSIPTITLPQPLPSLVAEGVVTALSMMKSAPAGLVGGRLLIHAGTKAPTGAEQQDVGDWQVQPNGAGGWSMRHLPTSREAGRGQNLLSTPFPAQLGHEYGYRVLPLGAIVASATLAACVPIERIEWCDEPWSPGRWAWLLVDVAPTTERCPLCWGLGLVADGPFDAGCPACAGAGRCDPIPARGRPGVWRWRP